MTARTVSSRSRLRCALLGTLIAAGPWPLNAAGQAPAESRGWIGQRQDPETGLTHLHARYYDPALGVFASPDSLSPIEPGVGVNRFAYAHGDPINASDPFGQDTDPGFQNYYLDCDDAYSCGLMLFYYYSLIYSVTGDPGYLDYGYSALDDAAGYEAQFNYDDGTGEPWFDEGTIEVIADGPPVPMSGAAFWSNLSTATTMVGAFVPGTGAVGGTFSSLSTGVGLAGATVDPSAANIATATTGTIAHVASLAGAEATASTAGAAGPVVWGWFTFQSWMWDDILHNRTRNNLITVFCRSPDVRARFNDCPRN